MIVDVIMPKMGESVNEGTVIRWYKKIGDKVKLDETVFEIATDKVDTEIPSPVEGVLTEILVNIQETVEVGTIVARISTAGEAVVSASKGKAEITGEKVIPAVAESEIKSGIPDQPKNAAGKTPSFFSPLVLNIAQVEDVSMQELENIIGSGQAGRVTKKDILDYIASGRKNSTSESINTATVAEKPISVNNAVNDFVEYQKASGSGDGVEVIPMDNIRQRIMHHMVASRDTSVHVSEVVEVDMSRIAKIINLKKDEFLKKEGVKLTYLPFIAQSAVKALKAFPLLNSALDGTNILQKKFVNLGIAVAVEPNGLIVPNIKNADEKSLIGLAKAITELANKSRNKKLIPDDIVNGTFTITNYGVFGALFGTPIINQPEVAILGVGAVVKRVVVVESDGVDTIVIKPMMFLTLSHDHRLVDGMLGGKFLKSIKDSLENFVLS